MLLLSYTFWRSGKITILCDFVTPTTLEWIWLFCVHRLWQFIVYNNYSWRDGSESQGNTHDCASLICILSSHRSGWGCQLYLANIDLAMFWNGCNTPRQHASMRRQCTMLNPLHTHWRMHITLFFPKNDDTHRHYVIPFHIEERVHVQFQRLGARSHHFAQDNIKSLDITLSFIYLHL